jgi:selenocysteine lyase/cysteine desulfurase
VTPEAFRACFPILARRVYVNSCSQGALSLDVEAALAAFTESWHAAGSPWDRWVAEVERLRTTFAAQIGADPDEIAVMPSASTAIAAVATALSFETSRRKVVLGDFEFPTMAHVWQAQQPRGAEVVWARGHPSAQSPRAGDPGGRDETLPIDAYAEQIDHRTLIVPATHVCFRNGYRLDIPALVALCRAHGAYTMLDDYQRTGTAPIDVHGLGVDFMVTGALKYLLGPAGIAFLYVRRGLIDTLTPLATGWFGRIDPFTFSLTPLDWSATARRFEGGTPPIPNAFAAAAGLDLLQSIGLATVDRQIRHLVSRFHDGARRRGLVVATPADPERRGPLVVIRAADAGELVRRLENRGIIASARGDGLRVSFHAYNTDGDVDAVLEGLEHVE